MSQIFTIFTLLSLLLISGCGFIHDEHITGPYRLIAIDGEEQMSVCYDLGNNSVIGRISETVFAYGFDKRFIVAKQHPNNNRSITNYFYLEMSKDSRAAEPSVSVIGPLSKNEFEKVTKSLSLPSFTRTIKSLN